MQEIPQLTFYSFNDWQNDGDIQIQNEVIKQNKTMTDSVSSIKDQFDQTIINLMRGQ